MNPLITPRFDLKPEDERGFFVLAWYKFWDSITTLANDLLGRDYVYGGSSLTHDGRLTMVSPTDGEIKESAVTDDGATVTALARQVAITGTRPEYKATATAGTQPGRLGCFAGDGSVYVGLNVSYDGTDFNLDDTSKTGTLLRLTGGALAVFSIPAHANPVTTFLVQTLNVSAAGVLNVLGYQVNAVAGEDSTITYGSSLGGVIPAGLTLNTKTITFTKGIETGHT